MADNTQVNAMSGGDNIHTDELVLLNGVISSGVKVQVTKVGYGDDGSLRHVSSAFPLPVTTNVRNTYRSSTTAVLVTATTVNQVFFVITGSATKIIKVQSIVVSGVTLTAVAYLNMGCAKYSTAPTGGTSTTLVGVPLDSTTAAATAVVRAYTAAPTTGTKVGDIDSRRFLGQATTAAAAGRPAELIFDFSANKDGGTAVLRGAAECIGLYWIAAPASAPSMLVRVDYTEE